MKKIMKKLTAVLLMAALVFSVAGVTDTAFAASSKITLKSGAAAPGIIYAGHYCSLKVPGASVKFYTTDKKVATIGLTTGKLKARAPGTVTVKAKSRKTGKEVARKTFTVRQRATSIKASDVYLNPGDYTYVKAKLTPSTSTDVIRFYSSDKEIVTIGATSGKAKAYKIGETTIRVIAKASKSVSNSSKANKTTSVNIYIGAYIDYVQQLEPAKIKVDFKTDVTGYDMKASDFDISNNKTKKKFAVKDISVSGNSVTLTTNDKMNDGGTYTVTYAKSSAKFTATDGRITDMEITPTVVPEKTSTEITVNLKDKDGVIVESYNTSNKPEYVDFSISTSSGFVGFDGKLYLNNVQSTATARAVYHTYNYEKDESGKTVETGTVDTGNVTITASEIPEPDPTPSYNPYSVQITTALINKPSVATADIGISTAVSNFVPDFDKPRDMVYCPSNTTVPLYFYITKYGEEVENYGDYTVSVSNDNVAELCPAGTTEKADEVVIDNTTKSIDVRGNSAGTSYLYVKNKNGTVVSTLSLLGGDSVPAYEFGNITMRLYGDNLTPGSSADSISVCNAYNYSNEKTSDFIGVTIRSMLYGRPMNYKENEKVHFGLQLKSVDGNTTAEDITGPISDYELEPGEKDDGIIEIDAGRKCLNGYVKPGKYTYLVDLYTIEHYSDGIHTYNKHIATKYFDVNVSGIDINSFNLSKKESGISADLFNKAKNNISNTDYDWTEFVKETYNLSVGTDVPTDIKVVSAEANVNNSGDTEVITFNTITFKLSQDINGQGAYIYYTYMFDNYEEATVSADLKGNVTESNIPAGE